MAAHNTPDARRLAWDVLNTVEAGAFADAELGQRLQHYAGEDKERRLATLLVYGTLTWQELLDHVLRGLGRAPGKLDMPLRTLLRLALFQIIKLDRVPDFAAVDTAVELAKTHRQGAGAKLVNALLRRFLREGKELHLPPRSDIVRHLSLLHSHPEWLVRLWLEEQGPIETEALLAADNLPAPTVLRVRAGLDRESVRASLRASAVDAEATEFSPLGLTLHGNADTDFLPDFARGRISFQGEASQLVSQLLAPSPEARVLDACAAPGGKATAIGERLGGGGFVLALDRNGAGLARLRRESERLGIADRVGAARADTGSPPIAAGRSFDAVLFDAPCSGLGTLRQHPEIRWRRTLRDIAALARRQSSLLAILARHVRPGGCIVYATCTLARRENQGVVEKFLSRHPDFQLDDPRPLLPPQAHPLFSSEGYLQTTPQRGGLDGFFAARLKRAGDFRMVPA